MALIQATTTVTVARSASAVDEDPADADYPAPTTVQSGLRAHIGTPSASSTQAGGTRVDYTAPFWTDPADIRPRDQLTDAKGNTWTVLWAKQEGAFGMDMVIGRAQQVVGED